MTDTTKFETEPLTEEIMQIKMMDNPLLARAINKNITLKWLNYIKFMLDHRRLINWNCVGKVRCQPAGSKVLMANGEWKNIEEIKIGDKVISPCDDGCTIETVREIHKGYSEIYEVRENKRKKKLLYKCAANHFIPVDSMYSHGHEKRQFYWKKELITAETFSKFLRQKRTALVSFTSPQIEKFSVSKNPEIEPYCLGLFLGDGHYKDTLSISSDDFESIEYVSKHYPIMNIRKKQKTSCKDYDFSINGEFGLALRKLGLQGKNAGEKFIPTSCLLADAYFRKHLLAGLLDSDGSVDTHGGIEYCTKSKQLAENFKFLVFSLGGYANIKETWKSCQSFKEKRLYYRISLNFPKIDLPVLVRRKWDRIGKNPRFFLGRVTLQCVDTGKLERVYGFTLSGKTGFYVTDNWMVTKNSGKSWSMVALCVVISKYSGVPFGLDNILQNQSQYLNQFKFGRPNELFLVDEFEVSDSFGMGATAEFYQQTDTMRIAAKRILHRINLVGEETSIGTNADYVLSTVGIDYENFATKLLVHRIERGTEIPIGYIIIPVAPILCQDILEHKTYGCLGCPKYDDENLCSRWFPRGYEKKKDINIKRLTQENYNFRTKLRIEVAKELLNNPVYCTLKKKSEMTVFVRNMAPRFTNRVLTEKEIEEIVTITKMAQKEGDLLNEMEKAVPPLVDLETGKPLGEAEQDDAQEESESENDD